MKIIKSFKEIRRDGKVIDEKMTVQDILNKGWGIEPIVCLKWNSEGKKIEVQNAHGILAGVVRSKTAVVGMFSVNSNEVLKVLNPDGSLRFTIPNTQKIENQIIKGTFEWFEPPKNECLSSFCVVFKSQDNGNMFLLTIDSESGDVLSVNRTM